MKAYYFSTKDRRLRYDDDRPIVVGETHTVDADRLEPCAYGLHASVRLLDALSYAPGPILYLVELGGKIVHGSDKLCASERTYLAEFDATDVLRQFARRQALINIELIKPYCSTENYDLIVRYLETGDEGLRTAAQSAARSAAARSAAARSAAARSPAAYAAAEAARSAATYATAWSAATYATAAWSAAAEAAAWSAAEAASDAMLTEMVMEATGWEV